MAAQGLVTRTRKRSYEDLWQHPKGPKEYWSHWTLPATASPGLDPLHPSSPWERMAPDIPWGRNKLKMAQALRMWLRDLCTQRIQQYAIARSLCNFLWLAMGSCSFCLICILRILVQSYKNAEYATSLAPPLLHSHEIVSGSSLGQNNDRELNTSWLLHLGNQTNSPRNAFTV